MISGIDEKYNFLLFGFYLSLSLVAASRYILENLQISSDSTESPINGPYTRPYNFYFIYLETHATTHNTCFIRLIILPRNLVHYTGVWMTLNGPLLEDLYTFDMHGYLDHAYIQIMQFDKAIISQTHFSHAYSVYYNCIG